jgi:hypothetical protein
VPFDLSKRLTRLLFIFILALSIALQGYGHACGLILTSDSYQYLSAALSFKASGNFLSPDGSYYTYWPPLFPVILSFFDNPEHALIWIHVLARIFIGLFIYFLANKFLEKNIIKIFFLVVSLCSVQMMMISVFLWSELIFLLLLLLAVYCALRMKESSIYFLGLLLFSFLLCLQRNAGAFIIPAVSLWIFLDSDLTWKERITKSAILMMSGLAGLFLWNIYISFFIPSNFYFYKHNFFMDSVLNFSTLSTPLIRLFVPGAEILATFFGVILFLVVVVYVVKADHSNRHLQLLGLLILFYWIGLMVMVKLDGYETDRYLSVVIPFVYVMSFCAVERGFKNVNSRWQWLAVILLCLWTIYPVVRSVKNVLAWNERSCLAYQTK